MVLQINPTKQEPVVTWEKLPEDFILPDDPVENIQQPPLAAALTDALGTCDRIQPEMLIASNFAIAATVNQKMVVKAPDWMYVPRVLPLAEKVIRRSYTPSLEGDRVAVAMEFLSETDAGEYSVRAKYPYGKLYCYEQIFQISTYVIFDPYELDLEVRQLQENQYVFQSPTAEGRYWIPEINLFLGIWYGTRLGATMHWLRWWDAAGNLLLWSSEKSELERQRAQQERQRAQQEMQRAQEAIAQLETERQRSESLAAKLRELGIDPNV
ncbi:MAG: hypothetical protein WBA89_13770 [Microcoleus sp.]|uniref:hypothetical protein n=1 Tax=Microcoleus sp. TaxID=44472 RepID=UPI003C770025